MLPVGVFAPLQRTPQVVFSLVHQESNVTRVSGSTVECHIDQDCILRVV